MTTQDLNDPPMQESPEEIEGMYRLIAKQSQILQGVAKALKGSPKPLERHSTHDLAEVAEEVRKKAFQEGLEAAARFHEERAEKSKALLEFYNDKTRCNFPEDVRQNCIREEQEDLQLDLADAKTIRDLSQLA